MGPKKRKPSGAQNRKRRLEACNTPEERESVRSAESKRKVARNKVVLPLRKRAMRQFFDEIKLSRGCADCGYRGHPAVLHFDHLPGFEKVGNVSTLISNGSKTKALAEVKKCEVVCTNCHVIRTISRKKS